MRQDDQVLSLFSLKGFLSSKYSRLPDWTLDTLQMLPAGEKKGQSRETSSCLASRFKTANKSVTYAQPSEMQRKKMIKRIQTSLGVKKQYLQNDRRGRVREEVKTIKSPVCQLISVRRWA